MTLTNNSDAVHAVDLDRQAYCILGIPIDAIEMSSVLLKIREAADVGAPFVVSTPNLNFLTTSQSNGEFRESLLDSDLCPVDGVPIVWVARLMSIPIRRRVAGSDIFEALKSVRSSEEPLKIFFFGSTEEIAASACRKLNSEGRGMKCVGWLCPGFGDLSELNSGEFITSINSSGADFVVVALGAVKGQLWLRANHDRLHVPIRSHLGAVVNFQAGTVKRAPRAFRKYGLEWLWRIIEEPLLWKRYSNDGIVFLALILTRVLPLILWGFWQRMNFVRNRHDFVIRMAENGKINIKLQGAATAVEVDQGVSRLKHAVRVGKPIIIDLTLTRYIDARFFGLLLMLRKHVKARGIAMEFVGVSKRLRRLFRLNGVENLLTEAS